MSRSGPLILVTDGRWAVTSNPETGHRSRVVPLGSVLRMMAVADPWEPVAEADWPDEVAGLAAMLARPPAGP